MKTFSAMMIALPLALGIAACTDDRPTPPRPTSPAPQPGDDGCLDGNTVQAGPPYTPRQPCL